MTLYKRFVAAKEKSKFSTKQKLIKDNYNEINKEETVYWIKNMQIDQVNLKITFVRNPTSDIQGFVSLASAIGAQSMNVENAMLSLDQYQINFFLGTSKYLVS